MRRRPINLEQGPMSRQLAVFTDGGLAPEQLEQVRAWLAGHSEASGQAGTQAETNRRLLRLFRASRPKEPSPAAWEQILMHIESLLAGGTPQGKPDLWRPC